MTPTEARTNLDAVIREQLASAWQRGLDTAPHGIDALVDRGAGQGFRLLEAAVDLYANALYTEHQRRRAVGTESPYDNPADADSRQAARRARQQPADD